MQTQGSPPLGFVSAESSVEGNLVYRPAPEDVAPEEAVVDFTCPRCGGTRAYSVSDGGLLCDYRGTYEPPERKVVGKGAREFEFKLETLARAIHGWGMERVPAADVRWSGHGPGSPQQQTGIIFPFPRPSSRCSRSTNHGPI